MADTKKIKIGVKLVSNHKKHQKRAKITKVKNVANPVKSRLCEKFHKEFTKLYYQYNKDDPKDMGMFLYPFLMI